MICGMGISLYLLISQIGFCADMWKNDYKAQVFDTFLSYFFSVSKGIVLISVGIAFFCFGCCLPLLEKEMKTIFVHTQTRIGWKCHFNDEQIVEESWLFEGKYLHRSPLLHGFLGAGNNPMVGMIVDLAVAVEESLK